MTAAIRPGSVRANVPGYIVVPSSRARWRRSLVRQPAVPACVVAGRHARLVERSLRYASRDGIVQSAVRSPWLPPGPARRPLLGERPRSLTRVLGPEDRPDSHPPPPPTLPGPPPLRFGHDFLRGYHARPPPVT